MSILVPFPSPIGVLLISTRRVKVMIKTDMFPSPIGVLLISTLSSASLENAGLILLFAAHNIFI